MFELDGKTALVTGSSRGIGRATAIALARAGAKVVVSSRKQDACDAVVEEIREGGGEAIAIACNVSHKDQCQSMVDKTLDAFGRIDTLVCNASVNPHYGPMAEMPDSAFEKILTANVTSYLWLSNMVAPQMAERGDGSIVLISSTGADKGSMALGGYAISKAAERQMARNLAVQWGKQGVRANSLSPGLVKTDFAKALWTDPRAENIINNVTPMGRIGEPEDIADVVVFLASDASRWITGQTLRADGGLTISETF
ncbi:MAG: SDR family oxidoreductase [Rhodospirillales bacterium]|nr:SDR family oxidoreductase [Rhodospirillales bacterium]